MSESMGTKQSTWEALAPVFPAVNGLRLDFTKTIPLDFAEKFNEAVSTVEDYNPFKAPKSQIEKVKKLTGVPSFGQKAYYLWEKGVLVGLYVAVLFFAMVGTGTMLAIWGRESSVAFPLSMIGALAVYTLLIAIVLQSVDKRYSVVLPNDWKNSEYKRHVKEWALQRYGVKIERVPCPDAIPVDLFYVGEANGKRVYYYETLEGWVLGSATNEELPQFSGRGFDRWRSSRRVEVPALSRGA